LWQKKPNFGHKKHILGQKNKFLKENFYLGQKKANLGLKKTIL
jgi:hypothetical protein